MGKPEDLQKEEEARAKKVDLIPAETKTAFEEAINQIEDLALLSLAQKYLAGVAYITNDKLGAFMRVFVQKNNINERSHCFELIRTINAYLFIDNNHNDRIEKMTIFISQKETVLKAKLATNN